MTQYYKNYIARGKALAMREGLLWALPYADNGIIPREHRWNISRICNVTQGRIAWVRTFETYKSAVEPLNALRFDAGLEPIAHRAMRPKWIEFYKAVMLERVYDGDLRPHSSLSNIGQHIRLMDLCSDTDDPSLVTGEDIQRSYNVALAIGQSGKLALNLATVIRTIVDHKHLAEAGPLASYCIPYPDIESVNRHRVAEKQRIRQSTHHKTESRKSLDERLGEDRLPDIDTFWELMRILYTVQPRTFSDALRFEQIKLLVLTGFRIGEVLRVPNGCLQLREYFDYKGRDPAAQGGVASSLRLRHFAEKQTLDKDQNGFVLAEAFQDVPELFADPVRNIIARARALTEPMRNRLMAQVETGRLFPDLALDAIVPDWELYLRLSGNIQLGNADLPASLVKLYRRDYSQEALDDLRAHQIAAYHKKPNIRIREYFKRWGKKDRTLVFRDVNGHPTDPNLCRKYTFRVSDIERYVAEHLRTKQPVLGALSLSSGGLFYPHEFLFLYPTRSIVEDRDGGVLDISKYVFVGLGSELDLNLHLGAAQQNIFTIYGKPEAEAHKINPHALRHLQNNELFRHGVSDSLITMRFGRKSPVQSHVYNHKSLAEDLDFMEAPGGAADTLLPNARKAFHLISEGLVEGTLVVEFRRIQAELGDLAAFDYLNAEAGGLHVTPYGICLSSLTVDPCPKHLECFNNCKHFARTGLPSETAALTTLRDQMIKVITSQDTSSISTKGAHNQAEHAKIRLAGIDRALATKPGGLVSPGGVERHRRFVVTRSGKAANP